MRKIILMIIAVAFFGNAFAANTAAYKVNDEQIEQLFSTSEDVSFSLTENNFISSSSFSTLEEPTKTGFLLRAWFCGWFGLHRSYMGTKGMFLKYFCTFDIVGCVDFWGVVIKGDEGFAKFKGNDKFWVWGKK